MALEQEDFSCICGSSFETMELLTEHWRTNNTQTTGRPHYRLVKFASTASLHSEDLGMPKDSDANER